MKIDRNELDRYITGNYGEDQFVNEPEAMLLDELKAVQEKHKPIAAIDDPPTRFFNAMGNKQAELRRAGELWDALSNAIEQIERLQDALHVLVVQNLSEGTQEQLKEDCPKHWEVVDALLTGGDDDVTG